jgi:asparagine synthase (glutamine-hydrolysing)
MRLPAAHRMEAGTDGARCEEYWLPDLHATLPVKTAEDHIALYRELLDDVVRRASRAHRPVAFEVSGGLDSSALFAVAETLRRSTRLPAPGIQGYTLNFSGEPHADELGYARAVGRHLETRIREIAPAQLPLAWYREQARMYREFPGYPNGTMSLNLREAARANGCRSLVTGVGGDESLGMGRPGQYYAEELAAGQWRTAWECFRHDCRTLGTRNAAWWAVRSGPAPMLPEPVKRIIRAFHARARAPEDWLAPRLRAVLDERRLRHERQQTRTCARRGQVRQLSALADAFNITAREWEERFSATLGLELRSPYWNARIVQFAFSTPERLRSLGRSTKRFHRQALRRALPALVLDRTTKADFMVMFRRQLAAEDSDLRAAVSRRSADWVRPDLAGALLDRGPGGPAGSTPEWQLWTLVGCDALL